MGGLPARKTVHGFAVSPKDARVMYAALGAGLFRSDDAGRSWGPLAGSPRNLAAVALNPQRPDEVFVATSEGQVFRSADGGKSWERRR